MIKLGLFVLLLCPGQMFATSPVYVYGHRSETDNNPGKSSALKNSASNLKSTSEWLRELNSVELNLQQPGPQSTQSSMRLRGHDQRAQVVYLDEIKIFDPLFGISSLPLLDFESMGSLELFYGKSGVDLPEITTAGALRLRSSEDRFSSLRARGELTSIDSQLFSLLGRYAQKSWTLQLYGRRARGSGRYQFFDNRGTPDNSTDDRLSWRRNADNDSRMISMQANYHSPSSEVSYLSLSGQDSHGLAALGGLAATTARHQRRTQIHSLRWRLKNLPMQPLVYSYLNQEKQLTLDPARDFLATTDLSQRSLNGRGLGVQGEWQAGIARVLHRIEEARVDSKLQGQTFKRRSLAAYTGARFEPTKLIDFELKLKWQSVLDKTDDQTFRNQLPAYSLGLNLHTDKTKTWLQFATRDSPPTLVEQFGDGRYVMQSQGLSNERHKHHELGAQYLEQKWSLVASLYHDIIGDKIQLLPSLPNTVKAQNIGRYEINGIEALVEYKRRKLHASAGYNYLDASLDGKLLPHTARHQAKVNISLLLGQSRWSLATRARSTSYRDLQNKLPVPAHSASDFYWQHSFYPQDFFCKLEFAAINAFNQLKLSEGQRTYPYSEAYGYPLPGRYYRLTFKLGF